MSSLISMNSISCLAASDSTGVSGGARSTRTLTVFAAISLRGAFDEIAGEFERANPGVSVVQNLEGSQRLRTQLEHGARADVFASADQKQMDLADAGGMLEGPAVSFATNGLAVIVPIGNGPVTDLKDLGNQGVKLSLASPDVPAGGYARHMIAKLGTREGDPDPRLASPPLTSRIMANVVTLETNVSAVATKVALGEVDAGVVYMTDVVAEHVMGRVRVITIPENSNVVAAYPVAALRESNDPRLANDFIRFLLSPVGQSILESHGFGPAAP